MNEVEHHYELDLDAPTSDIDEAFKDAVAAVDRQEVRDDTETAAGDGSDPAAAEEEAREEDEGEGTAPDATAPDATAQDLARLDAENKGLRERLMRTLADFDNFRKRTEREKRDLGRFAVFDVIKDFLGVVDNLERASESSGSTEDLKQGLQMIIRQQEEIMRRHGVEWIEAVGKPFDPKVHEAVARVESTEVEVATVTQQMQTGYLLWDRLLRPAMVFVSMPSTEPEAASDPADPADPGEEKADKAAD